MTKTFTFILYKDYDAPGKYYNSLPFGQHFTDTLHLKSPQHHLHELAERRFNFITITLHLDRLSMFSH